MKRILRWAVAGGVAAGLAGADAVGAGRTFGEDVAFLKQHTDVVLLQCGDAQVAVAPAYQGRVMTSTTGGAGGPSFGWLNDPVIAAGLLSPEARPGTLQDHIYVFGGEERFWLGPEGGQYALYFAPGAKFEFDAWHTPAPIDTEPYAVASRSADAVTFRHDADLVNYSRTRFRVGIERSVRLLTPEQAAKAFGVALGTGVHAVAYETDNRVTNRGTNTWTREGGLLSIWLLGMYKPSPAAAIVVPFKPGPDAALGPKVNDAYFGKIPGDYLVVKDRVLFLRADGTRRGKIGLSPARSLGLAGSYDGASRVLTLISCGAPATGTPQPYVNSMWEIQARPYAGDALNAYNDGAPAPGKPPLGPFYELETSSPAAALAPGETARHVQRTIHIAGPEAELNRIAQATLGVSLAEIAGAFRR